MPEPLIKGLPLLQLQDLTWLAGIAFIGITSLIQAFSKRFSPWTWILEQMGRSINKESLQKLDEINDKVTKLEKWNERQDEDLKLIKVLDSRRRILRCADEISHQPDLFHTEEYFNEILCDINAYEKYCRTHPEFKNSKAVMSIELVTNTYKKCLKENTFL